MNITELRNTKTFLEDKINRMKDFEANVDVDNFIEDEKIANSVQFDIASNVLLERFDFIGIVPLDNINYYCDVFGKKIHIKYPQVYAYLLPEYNEFSGQWNYEEKILFLKEVVDYEWKVLKILER